MEDMGWLINLKSFVVVFSCFDLFVAKCPFRSEPDIVCPLADKYMEFTKLLEAFIGCIQ